MKWINPIVQVCNIGLAYLVGSTPLIIFAAFGAGFVIACTMRSASSILSQGETRA